jgi:hypothetical protein
MTADKTVFCCQGWPVDGRKVHTVNRYRIGPDGQWMTLGKAVGDNFAIIVNARRDHALSHGCCTECAAAMRSVT